MLDTLRDAIESVGDRVKSPFIGSILVSFIVINWKVVLFILFADTSMETKFSYFDDNTTAKTLLYQPLALGIFVAVLLPWLRLAGSFIARWPMDILHRLQQDIEIQRRVHGYEQSIKEIEARAEKEALEEKAKIDAAKRLNEAKNVGDEELIESLEQERRLEELVNQLAQRDILLLEKISESRMGDYHISERDSDLRMRIGGESVSISNRREFIDYSDSIARLEAAGFLDEDNKTITDKGFRMISELLALEPHLSRTTPSEIAHAARKALELST